MHVQVYLYTPLPARTLVRVWDTEIGASVVARWSTGLPGGFLVAEIPLVSRSGEASGDCPRPYTDLVGREHVVIRVGGATVFEGMLVEVTRVRGEIQRIVAHGYGMDGLDERLFPAIAGTTSAGRLAAAALALFPYIRVDSARWEEPGIVYDAGEFAGQTVREVLERIVRTGSGDGVVWDYAVWEGPTAVLQRRVEPAAPDWIVVGEAVEETVSFELATAVSVEYRAGDKTATVSLVNADLEARLGRTIERAVSGGDLDPAAASAFARTWLRRLGQPSLGVALRVDSPNLLRTPRGDPAPLHLVRAGQWVEVYGRLYPVTETVYDMAGGTLDLKLGEAHATWLDAWRRLSERVRWLQREASPETGARRKR
jgi:hypothetical protein